VSYVSCMHACMHVCMFVCMYVCMYVHYMHIHTPYACMHVCMYVCSYVCMYVYYMHIYTLNPKHNIQLGYDMKADSHLKITWLRDAVASLDTQVYTLGCIGGSFRSWLGLAVAFVRGSGLVRASVASLDTQDYTFV